MDFALGTVTLLALVMTVAMGVVTWRLVREERRRSAARLAALEAELRRLGDGTSVLPPAPPIDVPIPGEASDADLDITARDLFGGTANASAGWSRRFAAIGAAAAVIAAIIGLAVVASIDTHPEDETDQAAVPVELLALEHERQGSFLAISGSVRIPAEPNNPPSPLSVLARVYDEAGVMVASGRVPLQFAPPPGAESPFSISLPADNASRYRISFLSNDVTVPHVDLRPTSAGNDLADTETTSVRHERQM